MISCEGLLLDSNLQWLLQSMDKKLNTCVLSLIWLTHSLFVTGRSLIIKANCLLWIFVNFNCPECDNTSAMCESSGRCLTETVLCDGKIHCDDGSDEQKTCGQFVKANPTKCHMSLVRPDELMPSCRVRCSSVRLSAHNSRQSLLRIRHVWMAFDSD